MYVLWLRDFETFIYKLYVNLWTLCRIKVYKTSQDLRKVWITHVTLDILKCWIQLCFYPLHHVVGHLRIPLSLSQWLNFHVHYSLHNSPFNVNSNSEDTFPLESAVIWFSSSTNLIDTKQSCWYVKAMWEWYLMSDWFVFNYFTTMNTTEDHATSIRLVSCPRSDIFLRLTFHAFGRGMCFLCTFALVF